MPKLQEHKKRYFITIPIDQILAKGWEKGDRIATSYDDKGRIVLERIEENK